MTESEAKIAIETYQRRLREARNRELSRGMRGMDSAEQFLAALRALDGLRERPRTAAGPSKILQTLA